MARYSDRSLRSRAWHPELIPAALVALLLAGPACAEDRVPASALNALLQEDWARAVELLSSAPGARAQAYLSQAQAELHGQKLTGVMQRATAAVQQEDWPTADAAYTEALTLAPYFRPAGQGRQRVQEYLEAHQQLTSLRFEDGLFEPALRVRALEWEKQIRAKKLTDRKIERALRELPEILRIAEMPVALTLTSDGQSEIEIYSVGKLGRVTGETLKLLPGDYIVVASRAGYRDVRETLRVRPGHTLSLDIRCTEAIR